MDGTAMIRRKSQILRLWYAVWDLSLTALAWVWAYWIRMESGLIPITAAAIRFLRSRGYNQTHSIVVGTGRVARRTARLLRSANWMGIRNVGFVEDQPTRWTADLDVLGTSADLPVLIEKYHVSHIFI